MFFCEHVQGKGIFTRMPVGLWIRVESQRQKPILETQMAIKNKWGHIFFEKHIQWNLNLLPFPVFKKKKESF